MPKPRTPLIEQVGAAKRRYDHQMILLDAEYRAKKQALKTPVLDVLHEALSMNESMTQIATIGMGYASPGLTALKSFVGANGTSRQSLIDTINGSAFTVDTNVVEAINASAGAPEVYKWKEYINSGGIAKYTTYTLGGQAFEVIVRPDSPSLPAMTDSQYEEDKAEVANILRSFTAHTNGKYTYDATDQATLDSASTGQ